MKRFIVILGLMLASLLTIGQSIDLGLYPLDKQIGTRVDVWRGLGVDARLGWQRINFIYEYQLNVETGLYYKWAQSSSFEFYSGASVDWYFYYDISSEGYWILNGWWQVTPVGFQFRPASDKPFTVLGEATFSQNAFYPRFGLVIDLL